MDPATLEEHLKRASENTRTQDGFVLLCCPFCCEPDFITYPVGDDLIFEKFKPHLEKDTTCNNCERSAKVIFHENGRPELVQTGGPDAPSYLTIRRQS